LWRFSYGADKYLKDDFYNKIWFKGVSLANKMQRTGLLNGRIRSVLRKIGHVIVPAPDKEGVRKLPDGMKIYSPAGLRGIRGYITGVYEEALMGLVNSIIEKGMTVIDIGAMIGLYTLKFSSLVGSSGHVYSFEPEPLAADFLHKNVKINQCSNVTIIQKAVADKKGASSFVTSRSLALGPVGGFLRSDQHLGDLSVDVLTLDDFFSELNWPSVDLIKMDIDGAEILALRGMKELSQRNPDLKLIMEFDPRWAAYVAASFEEITNLLIKLGFVRGQIIERKLKTFYLKDGLPIMKTQNNVFLIKSS
jgi:FkbM family methyltransferase